MSKRSSQPFVPHARFNRRTAIQAGAIGMMGMNHLSALRDAVADTNTTKRHRSVIYIFLSGGLSQHESFDMKPHAPDKIRGEFNPISTSTAGTQISEHLPLLATRSDKWSIVRSMTHPYNEHSEGHHVMLTGRTPKPRNFSGNEPRPTDFPCIASVIGSQKPREGQLPPAIVLPEKLIHVSGRTIPGQFAGIMGSEHDPWFVEASKFRSSTYYHGAFPEYGFHRTTGFYKPDNYIFESPSFTLPQEVVRDRFRGRVELLKSVDRQRRDLDRAASVRGFDRYRQEAVSLLLDGGVHKALDVHSADDQLQERYGRNSFGWSLLMARQLVEAGVSMVQVNLGNDESWDTHEAIFRNMREFLLPPTDKAVSALLDDLDERGLLEDTLVVMAGEFGRTPQISVIPSRKTPGRDHWGPLQSVFFAGGGVVGGRVIGASDKIGAYPIADPQKPENMAATVYDSLGIPSTAAWYDKLNRPHFVYHAQPIEGLS
ncbi:MAG: hypothetical protein CMJ78_02815 [Planctomycetaceae bacterium]|nr:hypothetical protein [Planctomycetaceae bacterium]